MNISTKTISVVLALSIGLNLFFIGVWAGRRFGGQPYAMRREGYGVSGFLRHSGIAENDPAVKRVLEAHRSAVRERMRALHEARVQVREALTAEPFDATRLESQIGNVKSATSALQAEMLGAMLELSRSLDVEQRKRMADALWPRPRLGRGREF
jgi:uncharacterized membrane protein